MSCIPIGLFVPIKKNIIGIEILKGVQLAINEENENGGYRGKTFCIKKRWSEDPWGSGSKDVIDLIYKDKVLGIIAYKNGASHIALQIAAKINIPVLSPITTDPSLTATGVPWIFRLAPDDTRQAEILYKEGIKKYKIKRVGIISEIDHDIGVFAKNVLKVLKYNKNPPIFFINISDVRGEKSLILNKMKESNLDGLIVSLKNKNLLNLFSLFREEKIGIPVFSSWKPGLRTNKLKNGYPFPIFFIEPFKKTKKYHKLKTRYFNKFKHIISNVAIYSYDCTKILISSIRKKGFNRVKIRKGLIELSGYMGVSGIIRWDNSGSNKTDPVLIKN